MVKKRANFNEMFIVTIPNINEKSIYMLIGICLLHDHGQRYDRTYPIILKEEGVGEW